MDTASPAVSPSVVAAILMTQKMSVTWGTLLRVSSIVQGVQLVLSVTNPLSFRWPAGRQARARASSAVARLRSAYTSS